MDPRRGLSALMYAATRVRFPPYKNLQIRWFVRRYGVDMSDAVQPNLSAFPDFNSFFTRTLRPETRPLPDNPSSLCSPADGIVSARGSVNNDTLVQAKGHSYSLAQLLTNESLAGRLEGGTYLTIYLSPRDYHRVHSPCDAALKRLTFVPGKHFSVSPDTVARVPNLFARNERVVFELDSALGPAALVMVGALCVSSIGATWTGPIHGPRGKPTTWALDPPRRLGRGDELAQFNMGSTVILVMPPHTVNWDALAVDSPIRFGQSLGTTAPFPGG